MSEADPAASSASEPSASSDATSSEPSASSDATATDATETQEAAQSSPDPKPRSKAVRIVLLLLLAVCVGTFAFDYAARRRRDQAFLFLEEAFPDGDENVFADPKKITVLGPAEVRGKLGKPNSTKFEGLTLVIDTFRFEGVFYSHELRVEYSGMKDHEMMQSIAKVSRFRVGR